jgi:hypothetical protein
VTEPSKVKVARLRERRARLGLVRVEAWVPKGTQERVREFVAKLIAEWDKAGKRRRSGSAGGGRDE